MGVPPTGLGMGMVPPDTPQKQMALCTECEEPITPGQPSQEAADLGGGLWHLSCYEQWTELYASFR